MPLSVNLNVISGKIKDLDGIQLEDRERLNTVIESLNNSKLIEKLDNLEEKLDDHINQVNERWENNECDLQDINTQFDEFKIEQNMKIDLLAYLSRTLYTSIEDNLDKKMEDHITHDNNRWNNYLVGLQNQKMKEYKNVSERFFWREYLMLTLFKYNNYDPVVYVEYNNLLEQGRKLEDELGLFTGQFSTMNVFHNTLSMAVLSQHQDRPFRINIKNPVNAKLLMKALS